MLGVSMSYVSHAQVWALQVGDRLYLGGKSNRAQVTFEREILTLLEALPQGDISADTPPAETPQAVS
jgi:cytochrome c biogenesis protein